LLCLSVFGIKWLPPQAPEKKWFTAKAGTSPWMRKGVLGIQIFFKLSENESLTDAQQNFKR
jgi:hypothetical protein